MKILIIEDDDSIVSMITLAFQMRWPEAQVVSTQLGEEGLQLVEDERPDIVILDLGLPDINGFEVLKHIRLFSNVPVIMLTVRHEERDIVKAIEMGADDYIAKPFGNLELLARVKAQIRRQCLDDIAISIEKGPFRFAETLRIVFINGVKVTLTKTEGQILHMLLKNSDNVINYSTISRIIWGDESFGSQETIHVYMRRIREKIEEDPSNPKYLLNKHGIGYTLNL